MIFRYNKLLKRVSIVVLLGLLFVLVKIGPGMYLAATGNENGLVNTASEPKITIVLDPGHGGDDPGRINNNGGVEKEINLQIAKKLLKKLQGPDMKVVLTREGDSDLWDDSLDEGIWRENLNKRIEIAEVVDPDFFISIHCNANNSSKYFGAQTIYSTKNSQSRGLADSIQASFLNKTNTSREAIVDNKLYILKNLKMPAVIIEVGFLSNPKEAKLLQSEEYQEYVATIISEGLKDYINLTSK